MIDALSMPSLVRSAPVGADDPIVFPWLSPRQTRRSVKLASLVPSGAPNYEPPAGPSGGLQALLAGASNLVGSVFGVVADGIANVTDSVARVTNPPATSAPPATTSPPVTTPANPLTQFIGDFFQAGVSALAVGAKAIVGLPLSGGASAVFNPAPITGTTTLPSGLDIFAAPKTIDPRNPSSNAYTVVAKSP